MNFKEWSDKYYPGESDETLKKMSHAWASGNVGLAIRLHKIADIIESVDNRCMAADGPVTPTLQEMRQDEISQIYKLAKDHSEHLKLEDFDLPYFLKRLGSGTETEG